MKKNILGICLLILMFALLCGCRDSSADFNTTGEATTESQTEPSAWETTTGHTHVFNASVILPSCTTDGYTLHTCSLCSEQYQDNIVPHTGHTYSSAVSDAACTEFKKTIFTCTVCKDTYAEPLTIPGTIHSYTAVITHPTNNTGGFTTHTCKNCGDSYTDNYTEPANYSVGLSYTNVSGRYYVAGIGTCKATDIVIPAVSEHGYTVAGILPNAFANTNVRSIFVSSGVSDIQSNAFYNCTSLTSVTLPAGATAGQNLFKNTPNLTSLTMDFKKPLAYYFYFYNTYSNVPTPQGYYAIEQGDGSFNGTYYGTIPLSLKNVTILGSVCNYVLAHCQSVTSVKIEQQITKINIKAFYKCTSLSQINIPETVTQIGSYAFTNTAITSVSLPAGISFTGEDWCIFQGCTKLSNVSLPNNIRQLPPCMFQGCTSLTSIQIPQGVTLISGSALANTGLKQVEIPDTVTKIGSWAFTECPNLVSVKLPAKLQIVEYGAFAFCPALQSLTFPDTTHTIEYRAMEGCSKLQSVTLPSGLQEIQDELFKDCISLKQITLPATIQSIGREAFKGCVTLSKINLPETIATINNAAFENTGLQSVTVPVITQLVGNRIFADCTHLRSIIFTDDSFALQSDMFAGCTALESIAFPANATSIPARFCKNAKKLKSIVLPAKLTAIGEEAFYGCTSLEKVVFPETLRTLQYRAFMGCTALKSVDFSNAAVTWSGEWEYAVFADCVSLKEVKNHGQLSEFNASIFQNTPVQTVKEGLTITLGWLIKADPAAVPTILNVPNGVTKIKSYVFSACTHVTEATLPEGVVYVGSRIFGDHRRSALKTLVLPDSLQTFSTDTTYFLPNLQELSVGKDLVDLSGNELNTNAIVIRFRGTVSEFHQLLWRNNTYVQKCTIICTDATIPPATV